MRSVALLALLAYASASTAITPQALTAPTGSEAWSLNPHTGSSASSWFTFLEGTTSMAYTYTLSSSDIGKNFYFRTTLYNCTEAGSVSFQTVATGNDGSKNFLGIANPDFKVSGTVGSLSVNGGVNASAMVALGGDSSTLASSKSWTWTINLIGVDGTQSCQGFADLITYGKVVAAGAVGANGIPGATQDAWIPCCDSTDSAYLITPTDQPHKYMEASVQSVTGEFNYIKLTNPGSVIGLADVTNFPSSGKGIVTARTCLSNQSCEVLAKDYYVHIITHGIDYDDPTAGDFHATFTLTTKAGVASASAAIAMLVAALFALFH